MTSQKQIRALVVLCATKVSQETINILDSNCSIHKEVDSDD